MPDTPFRVTVHVQPNAGRNKVVKYENQVLYVKLAAPPVEGKANQALVKHLSDVLHIPKSNISIERGLSGRNKTVALVGVALRQFEELVERAQSQPTARQ